MPISRYIETSNLARPGVCTSTTRPASPFEGQAIYETDTDKTFIWNGATWVEQLTTTVIDAKGDLIVGTAADTAARVAVGTNNHVLLADSAQTSGVRWSTNPVVCTSGTRPSSPYNGMFIYETDTNMTLQYQGSSWVLPWEQRFARTTLTTNTTPMQIASIPQYGNTLHIRGMMRSTRAGFSNTGGRFRLNNASNATDYYLAAGGVQYQQQFGYMGQMPAATAFAGEFGTFEIYVPDYSTNTNLGGRKFATAVSASYSALNGYVIPNVCGVVTGIGGVTSVQILDDVFGNLVAGSYLEVWIGP